MTFEKEIAVAEGNGKSVRVFQIQSVGYRRNRHGELDGPKVIGYSCEVTYTGQDGLDFGDSRSTKADAMRWFKCWSMLTK